MTREPRPGRAAYISPFRYPGGKTWFVPAFRLWLQQTVGIGIRVVEPFAGGASVSLAMLAEGRAKKAHLIEKDDAVRNVWWALSLGLADKIIEVLERETESEERAREFLQEPILIGAVSARAAAQTILLNRLSYSGVMTRGAGLMAGGENGRGLFSRWYPETIYDRLRRIDGMRHRLVVPPRDTDGVAVLRAAAEFPSLETVARHVFFIDPPYEGPGRRLYHEHDVSTAEVITLTSGLKLPAIMTLPAEDWIIDLGDIHGLSMVVIPMRGSHGKRKELILSNQTVGGLVQAGIAQSLRDFMMEGRV